MPLDTNILEQFTKAATTKIDDTLAKVKAIADEQLPDLKARQLELEQKMDARRPGSGRVQSDEHELSALVAADEGFKMVKSGRIRSTSMQIPVEALHTKAAITSSTSVSNLLTPDRQSGIVLFGQRRLTIRDLLPTIRTDSGSVEYVREYASSNQAAIVPEGTLKPESAMLFEKVQAMVVTIATWVQASVQILSDLPQLQAYVDNRLRYMVRFAEELQLLKGTGTGTDLLGLYTAATPYVAPVTVASPTKLDIIRLAMGQLENSNYQSTAHVLHPNDWTVIELLKNADGNYIKSNPADTNVRALWGKPIVTTTAMTAGTFLTGDFPTAATLYDRQDPTLDIATQDQDDFIRNLCKLRVEERVSLAVQLPGALVKGTFPAPT